MDDSNSRGRHPENPEMQDDSTKKAKKRKGGVISEKVRAARDRALAGSSAHEIGRMKELMVVCGTYRFGWTTSTIANLWIGSDGHSNIVSRLVSAGLAKRTEIYLGSRFDAMPRALITLTRDGVLEAEAHLNHIVHHRHRHTGDRIMRSNVVHDLKVQRLTARNLGNPQTGDLSWVPEQFRFVTPKGTGQVLGFETAAELGEATLGRKLPDIVWYCHGGQRVAVEVELTGKFGWELDETIARIVEQITSGSFDQVWIMTRSRAIAERYSKAFKAGELVRKWRKTEERKYVRDREGDVAIDAKTANCILVILKEDL